MVRFPCRAAVADDLPSFHRRVESHGIHRAAECADIFDKALVYARLGRFQLEAGHERER